MEEMSFRDALKENLEKLITAQGQVEDAASGGDNEQTIENDLNDAAPQEAQKEPDAAVEIDESETLPDADVEASSPKKEGKRHRDTPNYITGEFASSYSTWSDDAKKYIEKREREIAQGFAKHDELREYGRKFQDALKPFNDYLGQLGVKDATEIIQPLLHHEKVLRTGNEQEKQHALLSIAQSYGVDVQSVLAAQQSGNQPVARQTAPDFRYQTLEQEIAQLKQAQQQVVYAEEIKAIESHAILKDPKVANLVQFVIENDEGYRGKKPSEILPDAIERALFVLNGKRESNPPVQIQQSKQNVENAKKMAVSPKGVSSGVSLKDSMPEPSSWEDAIKLTLSKKA